MTAGPSAAAGVVIASLNLNHGPPLRPINNNNSPQTTGGPFPNAINRDGHLSMGNINRLPSKLKTGGRRHGSQMSVSKMKHISRSCLERDAQRRRARYCSPPPHRTAVSKERARERVVSVTSRSLAQPLESDVSLMTRSAKFN